MTPTVGGGPSSGGLAVFDATGDGIPDLVVAGSAILVFPGKGDGTFAEAPIVTLLGDYSLFNIAFADLNHDGKIDLLGGVADESGSVPLLVSQVMGQLRVHRALQQRFGQLPQQSVLAAARPPYGCARPP
jgi:hypothetical protein